MCVLLELVDDGCQTRLLPHITVPRKKIEGKQKLVPRLDVTELYICSKVFDFLCDNLKY